MQGDLIPPSLRKVKPSRDQGLPEGRLQEIGRRRECRMMGGKLWDEVHMDCLSSEFERPVTPGNDWDSPPGYRREARRRLRSVPTTSGSPLNVGPVYQEEARHEPVPGLL